MRIPMLSLCSQIIVTCAIKLFAQGTFYRTWYWIFKAYECVYLDSLVSFLHILCTTISVISPSQSSTWMHMIDTLGSNCSLNASFNCLCSSGSFTFLLLLNCYRRNASSYLLKLLYTITFENLNQSQNVSMGVLPHLTSQLLKLVIFQ
jgi:hypothetical protein